MEAPHAAVQDRRSLVRGRRGLSACSTFRFPPSEDLRKNYQKVNRYKDELMSAGGFTELPVLAKSSMTLAAEIIQAEGLNRVLDIGANDRRFRDLIPEGCAYYSLDQDETFRHDFRSLADVERDSHFDLMAMFAVVEHVPQQVFFDEFIPFFVRHLTPHGYVVVSSNNVFHNLGIRTDYSHVQTYSPRDLHAIMRNFGFYTRGVYRICLMKRWYRWAFDLLSRTVFKPYCLDYCPEICWVFQRASTNDR